MGTTSESIEDAEEVGMSVEWILHGDLWGGSKAEALLGGGGFIRWTVWAIK